MSDATGGKHRAGTSDRTGGGHGRLEERARAWRDQDPDEETRTEIDTLLAGIAGGDAAASAELADRFASRLEFGTAGLRGPLGAGPGRMNRVLVAQAAAGLAAYLLGRESAPSVVIGFDGRKNSRIFALDTAEILAGAGVRALLLPRLLPTPVLAFAVRHLDTSAGVMVTASHNPAADNGYKVYLGNADAGSQIVPPSDAEIAAKIARVAEGSITQLPRSMAYETAGEDVLDEYVRRTAGLVSESGSGTASVHVVYTPLHGVGWETAKRVFAAAGFAEPATVPAQLEPDAAFPTVAFPNPEEPGALDLAFARAREVSAELVLVNDPDADRLAVGVPTRDGGWRRLSGNEVGVLLGWRAAERIASGDAGGGRTFAASIVSSPALAAIADDYGLDYVDTLTGFKWISRVEGLAYGFEEALGYLVDPQLVRDKDGISAAVDFLSLVSDLKARGTTLEQHLLDFAARFGAFASAQISLRVREIAEIPRIMETLRAGPPTRIAGTDVAAIDDFIGGFGSFPPSNILRIWLADGSRVLVRPSGTEPKLKVYIDAMSVDGTPEERMAAAAHAVEAIDVGMRALIG